MGPLMGLNGTKYSTSLRPDALWVQDFVGRQAQLLSVPDQVSCTQGTHRMMPGTDLNGGNRHEVQLGTAQCSKPSVVSVEVPRLPVLRSRY